MKRFRLGTLMLLIVIAALGITVVIQQVRATRREAALWGLRAELRSLRPKHPSSQEVWDAFLKRYREEAERRAEAAKETEVRPQPKIGPRGQTTFLVLQADPTSGSIGPRNGGKGT